MTPSPAHPYASLTPDHILDALDSIGLRGDGRLIALNSYENRVYQVFLEDGTVVVVKFYRPQRWSDAQILEEHYFAFELQHDEVPVVAPSRVAGVSLHHFGAFRFAVFPRQGGRAPELDAAGVLRRIGGFIGRIHRLGATQSFQHRPSLSIERLGDESRADLLASDFIPSELRPSWQAAIDAALVATRQRFAQAGEIELIRCHGDCHPGNVLWTDGGAHFVDLDDCMMAPAIQDLWMLVSGDAHSVAQQFDELLQGYEPFRRLARNELRLLEPLRTLRLLHYSAWLARRWSDPAFPSAFPWFNTVRYWQDRILEMREQIAALSEPSIEGLLARV